MRNTIKTLILALMLQTTCITPLSAQTDDNDSALESYNRAMFTFNTAADNFVIKPIAKGYRAVTTEFIRERVHDFYANLKEPVSMVNHTLQGNFAASGKSIGRFVINSTLGLLGTFDVASGWGLPNNKTDFDHTLAAWCVPDGPFFILPLIGPSTPRATTGMIADTFATPAYWADYYASFGHDWERYSIYYGITALGFISLREEKLEFMDNLTANSVDPYSTIKSAYIQNRLKIGVCRNSNANTEAGYDFDFDDMDDE